MNYKKVILTTAAALGLLSASAQEKLDTAVVSATRLQTTYLETGKTVSVISAEDIEQLPVNTLEDLLQDVAGINLNGRAAFGIQTDIGLRGSTFSQVLILIDNQRLNDGLTGHFNNNIPIPLSEIAEIEIIKGPSGVSYGTDAVGGVVHIKTKTYMAQPKIKLNFSGKVSKGEYGLNNNDLGLYLNTKKWVFSGGIKSLNADGQEFVNPNYSSGSGDSTYLTHFNQKNYTLAGAYFLDDWKFYVRGAMDARDFNAKYFYTASSFDESEEMIKAYWIQSAIIKKGKKQQTEFNIGYKQNQDTFAFNPTFPSTNGHTSTRLNATLTQNRKVKSVKLAYGLQYDQVGIESTDRGDHSNFSIAAFAQSRFKLSDHFLLLAGARVENDDYFGLQVIPQLTGTFILPRLVLRSSIGQSIRNGDFTERYVSYRIPLLDSNRNLGNPDLSPEKSFSADFNADWKITDDFRLSQSVFYRNSNNLIDYVQTNSNTITNVTNLYPNAPYYYASNVAESQTIGYELSANYMVFKTDSSWLQVKMDYTYLNTSNADGNVSKYIANHPIHSVAPRALFRHKRFYVSTSANLITRNADEIPTINGEIQTSYVLVNARISYKPPVLPARIFVEGRNLLNTNYQEILGAQMPQRWLYGGFIWRWGQKRSI